MQDKALNIADTERVRTSAPRAQNTRAHRGSHVRSRSASAGQRNVPIPVLGTGAFASCHLFGGNTERAPALRKSALMVFVTKVPHPAINADAYFRPIELRANTQNERDYISLYFPLGNGDVLIS